MTARARPAVYASAGRATHGGGIAYATAWAAALAEGSGVDLFLSFRSSAEELDTWLPAWPNRVEVRTATPVRSWRDEVRLARADRRRAAVVRETSHIPPYHAGDAGVLVTSFPFAAATRWRDRLRVASYETVVANSAFTARWVEQRWGRQAEVLHPPITPVPAGAGREMILAVGRFSGGGRSKRQLEMVDAFRSLGPDVHDHWELALAGFVEDPDYVVAVRERAAGLPVVVHADVERTALEALYGEAAIFWHACGLGVDERAEPDRVEHFGIVTAEAMSAGCVPVVLSAGGQPEVVGDDGEAGLLWTTVEEWVAATRSLIADPSRRAAMAAAARHRSQRFSFETFAPRARQIAWRK